MQLRQVVATVQLINNLGGGWDRSQWSKTEELALHPSGLGDRPQIPPDNAGPGVPNPAPLNLVTPLPEDLLKQNAEDMSAPKSP